MAEVLLCKNCTLFDIKQSSIVIIDLDNPDNGSREREATRRCGEPGSKEVYNSLDQIVCTDQTKFKPKGA